MYEIYTKKYVSFSSPPLLTPSAASHQRNGHHFGRETVMLNTSFICFSVDTRREKI